MFPGLAMAQSSHCTQSERTLFSCPLTQSKKIVSLCASPDLSPSSGYLQYRFGRANAAELAFPSEKAPPKGKFGLFRIQFLRSAAYGISFNAGGFDYTLRYVASGPDENDDEYQLIVTATKSEAPIFADVCDKAHIAGKTTLYPLEPLSKKLGIEILEKTEDN
jgi:hypothetical protein